MPSEINLKPRISEKAYALSEQRNTYIFDVPKSANKHSIARAVAGQFSVTVTNVRLASVAGKAKRSYQGRGKFVPGQRSDIRKAYVTLAEKDKLPLFNVSDDTPPAKEAK